MAPAATRTRNARVSSYCLTGTPEGCSRCPSPACAHDCHQRAERRAQNGSGAPPPGAKPAASSAQFELVWEEPPPDAPGRTSNADRVVPLLDALRSQPGQWARLAWFPKPNTAGGVRNGLAKKELGDFEFTARRVVDGSMLYGRFTAKDS